MESLLPGPWGGRRYAGASNRVGIAETRVVSGRARSDRSSSFFEGNLRGSRWWFTIDILIVGLRGEVICP